MTKIITSPARIIAAVFCCFLLTGCWDRVELEKRGFVISLGIDKYYEEKAKVQDETDTTVAASDKGNIKYIVSLSLPQASAIAGEKAEAKPNSIVKTAAATLAEAVSLADSLSSQKLYLGQAKICVLGMDILADETFLREIVTLLKQNRELNRKTILMCADSASEILAAEIQGEPLVGMFVSNYFKNNPQTETFRNALEDTARGLRSDETALIPMIKKTETGIMMSGAAVINNSRLAGIISGFDVENYLLCRGRNNGSVVTVEYQDENLALTVDSSGQKMSFFENNGNLMLNCEISVVCGTDSYLSGVKKSDETVYAEIEELVSKKLERNAAEFFEKLQNEYGADVLFVKSELKKHSPKLYEKYFAEWENGGFAKLTAEFHVNVKIAR